jgi:hypothetical protein
VVDGIQELLVGPAGDGLVLVSGWCDVVVGGQGPGRGAGDPRAEGIGGQACPVGAAVDSVIDDSVDEVGDVAQGGAGAGGGEPVQCSGQGRGVGGW